MGNALSFAFGGAETRGQVQIKKEHQGGRNHPGGTEEGYEDYAGYAARRLPPGVVSGSALKILIDAVVSNFS